MPDMHKIDPEQGNSDAAGFYEHDVHWQLIAGSAVVLVLSYMLARAGLELHWALLILAATPWVTVVGFEARGHEHTARTLQRIQ